MEKEIGIGILGLGHVGGETLNILERNRKFIEQEISPVKIKIIGLADLDKKRKPDSNIGYHFFSTSAWEVINHPDIQIIVEAVGGEYPAYNFIKQALEKGKHVVTPNKEVVAKHGYELLEIARENNVQFLFETSVGSAIPLLGVITNILTSSPLDEISGILNGTTNYILDLMCNQDIPQQEALKRAQKMGYAEADPSKDLEGLDALYKIFILATLAFRGRLNLKEINYSGISKITQTDIRLAKKLGFRIKLLAKAKKIFDVVDVWVKPVLIEKEHILAHIKGVNNGIFLSGKDYGRLFFSGAGAGGIAGASMIVSDIIKIIRQPHYFEYKFLLKDSEELKIEVPDQSKQHSYFVSIKLENNSSYKEKTRNILAKKGIKVERDSEIKVKDSLLIGLIISGITEKMVKEIYQEIEAYKNIKVVNCLEIYQDDIEK